MDEKIQNYVNDVLSFITANKKDKARIKEDLYSQIYESSQYDDLDWVLNNMGTPKDVAAEFMENIDSNVDSSIFSVYEYKSKIKIFNLPLVHIKFNRRFNNTMQNQMRFNRNIYKPAKAKGIIAIGEFATGILSIGCGSIGIISFGGGSLGLISFGGIALGALSIGGLSIGLFAFGGCAVGLLEAYGGLAISSNLACGGAAIGNTAIGDLTIGSNTFHDSNGYHDYSGMKEFLQNTDAGKNSLILKFLEIFY